MLVILLDPTTGLCYLRVWSEGLATSHSILSCRAPSPTKRKDRSDEKSKDRSKDKGATKESSEKDRGRDKTRKRRSASSGSSSTRWGRGNHVFLHCEALQELLWGKGVTRVCCEGQKYVKFLPLGRCEGHLLFHVPTNKQT